MAKRRKLAVSTKASRAHARVMAKTKPGTGKRFKSLTKQLKRKGAKNPEALAAWIGRKKYGKRMTSMAITGKRKHKKK